MSDPTASVVPMTTAGDVVSSAAGDRAHAAAPTSAVVSAGAPPVVGAAGGAGSSPAHEALVLRAAERAAGAVMPDEAVALLGAAVDALVAAEWWRCGQDTLGGAVVEVERHVARLDAARLRLLAEADARGVGKGAGATSTGAWFAHATTSRRSVAGAHVGLATAVTSELAATGDALAAGRLSLDHAGVIHRAMTKLPRDLDAETRARCEAFLVEQSAVFEPAEVAVMGTRMRRALVDDEGRAADREEGRLLARESLSFYADDHGAWHLRGVLAPESGARLHAALDPLMKPAPAIDGVRDDRPAGQRRAHALTHLADTFLAGSGAAGDKDHSGPGAVGSGSVFSPAPPSAPMPGSARIHLTVTVPISGVLASRDPGATPACLQGGFPLSPATLAAMTCDAVVTPILVDEQGSPLDVGQRQYAFPQRVRAAITLRDAHCTFPGCRRPPTWCQVHHLITYASGGPTSERNGTLLCGHHHRVVHSRGWRGHLDGARVIWHPPHRDDPHVPPPPWIPAFDKLVQSWRERWTDPVEPRAA